MLGKKAPLKVRQLSTVTNSVSWRSFRFSMELSSQPNNISTVESISGQSDPTVEIEDPRSNPNNGGMNVVKKKKRRIVSKATFSGASSSSSLTSQQQQRGGGLRVVGDSKNAKVIINGGGSRRRRRRPYYGEGDFDSLALPLGMSIAAFVAQVLDRNNVAVERISTDHLSLICTSAVKESLANVCGDRFDRFVKNFGESFGCTLKTLRLVNRASLGNGEPLGHSRVENINLAASELTYLDEHEHDQSSPGLASSVCHSASHGGHRYGPSSSTPKSPIAIPSISGICNSLDCVEEIQENMRLDAMNRDLTLHGEIYQQLACIAPRKLGSGINGSMLCEKSVMEQTRSNDLRIYEIGLKMKELQLKESELALSSDSNRLDRFKLSMGISKASFKAEKFKNQLEETRHAELLKKCIDCLVAGLFIMTASLVYGAYVYSYKRISEASASCISHPEVSKSSWWMPKQVTSINSGWYMVKCQAMVWSRMSFGVFVILAIAYLLLQRSSSSKQTMPVTQILLLLGIMCGTAGKLCVDTLGGSGYLWLLYWEALCLLHFLANICTSTFFMILHGSVSVSQGVETKARLPYWVRRFVFYTVTFSLPLLCGLMPFAGPSDWKDHFVSLATDALFLSIRVQEG